MSTIDDEFLHHIEETTDDLVSEGMQPDEARREAHRRFGSLAHYKLECQRAWPHRTLLARRSTMFAAVLQDIQYAVRSFRRHPGFLCATAMTLAIGIGASTVIFSVVDTVLLRPLPYVDADRLVMVGTVYPGRDRISSSSPMNFFDWQDRNDAFDLLVASRLQSLTLTGLSLPERVLAAGISAGYFELLGHSPFMGRGIQPEDDRPSGTRVVVLSHGTWVRRWGGAKDVIGKTVRLSGQEFEIVGVMGASFNPPEALYHHEVEMWFPLAFVDDDLASRDDGFLQVIGRLSSGATIARARQSLSALQRNIYLEDATDDPRVAEFRAGQRVGVEWLHEQTVGGARRNLFVFLGAVGFLLLIACANVANLFMVRAIGRSREIAVRTAMGAGQNRIVRQMLTEGLVTAAVGGIAGVVVAIGGVRLFRALAPEGIPRVAEIGVDLRVLAFTLVVSVVTGLLFGAAPALRYHRSDVTEALKDGALAASASRRQNAMRNGLVILETAVALVLFVGAGLLINSFVRRAMSDPGFDARGVVRMALFLDGYENGEQRVAFFDGLVTAIRAIPGVTAAAATNNLPMTRNRSMSRITVDGRVPADDDPASVMVSSVTDEFFETLRIPVVAGRAFQSADGTGEQVAVINTALARVYWQNGQAVGQRFKFGDADSDGAWFRVIGVAQEIHQSGLGEPAGPALYLPHAVSPFVFGNVIARTDGETVSLLGAMRRALLSVDPNMPVEEIGNLTEQMRTTVSEPRFYTWLLGSFAFVALALAAIGIYGTVSHAVSRRTHEIGIRLALGAGRPQVRTLIMRQGMSIVAIGLAIGLVTAIGLSRALSGFVFGIGTLDLPTIAIVTFVLSLVGALSSWLPTRRATRVEPMETLRTE